MINITLIIPALDPDERLIPVVEDAVAHGIADIIIVNDGSRAEFIKNFPKESDFPKVKILTHEKNRGKGAALKTAFSYFLENRPESEGVVTADSDGQHTTEDILLCAEEMTRGERAVILGCRDFDDPSVPPKSKFGNKCTRAAFSVFCGIKISDTQTGLRVIPREYVAELMEARGDRYEYETNMLFMIDTNRIPRREVKIHTVYFDRNSASHFRPIADSIKIYGLILRFAASSIASSVLDLLLHVLFLALVFTGTGSLSEFAATACARVISSFANFTLNKRVVFHSRLNFGKTLFRYVCLAIPVMIASWLCVYLISKELDVHSPVLRTLVKLPVDLVLYFINFRIQRRWVFAEERQPAKRDGGKA
ncbi:MAG: bifunctional glycosyltransferase family 2/GtrA family protein [Firmicutes bacterium]|nr:bifunctional glycosyltransferase family 2/GtrA family protein [Bacillota bacterium]